jgi:hypothetical protein
MMATGISPLAANSVARTRFRLLAAGLARVVYEACPSKQRAQEKPDALRTRSLASKMKKGHEQVTTGTPKQSGFSCAIGFNGFLRALSGDRLFVTIPGVKRQLHRQVNASVEASRPHDFAVRLSVHSS